MADAAAPAPAEAEPAAPIFKRKTNASNLRKRNRDAAEDGAEETKAIEPEQGGADAAPDRPGRPPKKDNTVFSTKELKATDEKHIRSAFAYSASNTAMSISDQKVFAQNIVDGDDETKAEAIKREKELKEGDVITDPDDPRLKDGKTTYKGLAAYSSHIEKKPSMIKAGPIKGASNIRVTTRFDYQPDLCKDYKETGYCCFGDSCKFMHDRGDYKSGWQLEKEWEKDQGKGTSQENYEIQPEPEEELPFACHICREPFTNPVVTKCEHYFCEKCALESYKKNNKCPVCDAPTQGIFNVAHKLIAKLKQRKRNDANKDK